MEELAAFAAAGGDQAANAATGRDASSSSVYSSDGSADSSWEPEPEDASSAEEEGEHEEVHGGDEGMDTSIISIDDDLRSKVTRLVNRNDS
jgi:hypothetical protein